MIKVSVKGEAKLARQIEIAKRKLGLSAGEFADFSARTVRDDVVRRTQPFGTGKKAREAGENAIKRDLHNAFRVVSNASRGKGTITSKAEAMRWHASRRNARGRVSRGERRPIQAKVFGELLEELRQRVGLAKGSVKGGDLPGKSQKWIKRHSGAGDATRRKQVGGAEWKFTADPPHVASPQVMGARGVRSVLSRQRRSLSRALDREIRRQLKKQERKINQGI